MYSIVYIFIYTYVYTHTYTYVTYKCVCIYIYIYTHMYIDCHLAIQSAGPAGQPASAAAPPGYRGPSGPAQHLRRAPPSPPRFLPFFSLSARLADPSIAAAVGCCVATATATATGALYLHALKQWIWLSSKRSSSAAVPGHTTFILPSQLPKKAVLDVSEEAQMY